MVVPVLVFWTSRGLHCGPSSHGAHDNVAGRLCRARIGTANLSNHGGRDYRHRTARICRLGPPHVRQRSNPYVGRGFRVATIAIAIPSAIEVIQWIAAIFAGGLRRATPLLFILGFVSLFITGGLTGPILAQPILDAYLDNTFFVVAHFHLIMGMAVSFALFAAIYYWFPLLTGKRMSERLGRWHFWLWLIGAYAVFFPMHFAGLAGEPRQYAQLTYKRPFFRICSRWSDSLPWRCFSWWRHIALLVGRGV